MLVDPEPKLINNYYKIYTISKLIYDTLITSQRSNVTKTV